ncbi:MAG: DNA gyrase inhibitor YacG [Rhodobacteraceae bacterium]|nr:MAG: DNA gyrase inhibitor YacG [Paracoccaceae bacterium]
MSKSSASASAGRRRGPRVAEPRGCPICGKPPDAALRPFCSRRCADVDLARWLRGDYAVPAVEDDAGMEGVSGDDGE